ncbi:murein hydrolase activator EnvC family protein [Streptomyces siamensis]|uniref:murein hydrolase activator EnvC family protein n=1 Tax=Streptomyces siamensis TaxID=1274986 RepID=UPI0031F06DA5
MRAKRCVRTWLGLLLGLVATVLGAGPSAPARANDPAPPAPAVFPASGSASDPGDGSTAGPAPRPATDPVPRSAADPVPKVGRAWPVGTRPPVVRGWEPPATVYSRGHRGVDLGAAPGAPVRAVAAGRVSFAGRVAGRGVVSVELPGTGTPPLRTTYEPVLASVRKGDEVAAGDLLGTVEGGGSHCARSCLHWGLLRGSTYLDPLSLLPPWLLRAGPSRLLPVAGVPRTPTT